MALPACECLPGQYPNWKALGPIVAAARTWAGEPPNQVCYDNRPIGEQLSALYCALATVAADGPAPPTPEGAEVQLLVDFTEPADGTPLSPANMTAAEVGGLAGSWAYVVGQPNPITTITVQDMAVTRYWPLQCLGTTYQTVSKVLEFDLSGDDADWQGLLRTFAAGIPNTSSTILMYIGATGNSGLDLGHTNGVGGAFSVCQVSDTGGGNRVWAHSGQGDEFGRFQILPAGWYIINWLYDSTGGLAAAIAIDNDTGELVVASQNPMTAGQDVASWEVSNYLVFSGGVVRECLHAVNTDGTFPLDPVTIPTPTVGVAQTANNEVTVTLGTVGQVVEIQRTSNAGGSWDVLEAAWDIAADGSDSPLYVDTTATNGGTYQYRIRLLVAALMSSFVVSDPVSPSNTGPTVSDDFTGASAGDPLNDRVNWDGSVSGTLQWFGNTAFLGDDPSLNYYTGDVPTQDQRAELTVVDIDTGGGCGGPAVGVQSGENTGYGLREGGAGIEIVVVNAGVVTPLDDVATTIVDGCKLAIQRVGLGAAIRLSAQIDTGGGWVDLFTNLDPGVGNYIDGGRWGIYGARIFGSTNTVDDWKGFNL